LGGDVAERSAILGALSLYLDFIYLFTLLLQVLDSGAGDDRRWEKPKT
jgi:FtsH-binding integral membrane protein